MGAPKRLKVEDAPILRPSKEEFDDLMKYIISIADLGSKSGLVLIIPPESWAPASHVDKVWRPRTTHETNPS